MSPAFLRVITTVENILARSRRSLALHYLNTWNRLRISKKEQIVVNLNTMHKKSCKLQRNKIVSVPN